MQNRESLLDTLYGPLLIPDWPDDLIVRSLCLFGEWCAVEARLAASLIEPDEAVWDAGAYVGTFSLGIAMHVNPGHVLAIEANSQVIECLSQNLMLLSCPSEVVPHGLASTAGHLSAENVDTANHGATRYRHHTNEDTKGKLVPCSTLSDLRDEHGTYDLLKLDLEGMELDALRGDFDYLRKRHPVIWAECNESYESLQLLSGLKWLDYPVFYVAYPAFRKANYRGTEEFLYPMSYEGALVAGPEARLVKFAAEAGALVPNEDIICRKIETAFDLRRALFDTPRWARQEWLPLSRAELIARLGRAENQESLTDFYTTK